MMAWPNNVFENLSVLQQKYWETVLGATQNKMPDGDNPLTQSMVWIEQWQTIMQSLLPEPLASLKSSLPPTFTVGKLYADLADSFPAPGKAEAVDYEWWISRMENYYQDWQKQLQDTPFATLKMPGLNTDMQAAAQQWAEFQKQYQEQYLSMIQQSMDTLQTLRLQLQEQPKALASFAELNSLWQELFQQTQDNIVKAGSSFPNLMESFSTWQNAVSGNESDGKTQAAQTAKINEQYQQAIAEQQALTDQLAKTTKQHKKLNKENDSLQDKVKQLKTQVEKLEQQLAEAKAQAASATTAPDDLTQIKGLGPKMQERLIDAGIQTFEQLASLSPEAANELDQTLNAQGRLVREDWVGQATEFSNKQIT